MNRAAQVSSKPVTLKEIAALVNKTPVTVSKALRDHPDISPETKSEIKAIAQKLGYRPNLIARKLSSRVTSTIGLIVPKVAHPFFSQAIEAIYDEAHSRGYDIFMMVSGEDDRLESEHVKTLLAFQVDGILISVSKRGKAMATLDLVRKNNKQIVFFDRIVEDANCSTVICDNYQGCYDLVSHAATNGYTRMGHLAGYASVQIGRERRRGFEQALRDAGLPIRPDWIVEGGFDQDDGYRGFMKIRQSGEVPQIICCAGFSIALGALKAIQESGLSAVSDVEVIAFGDSEYNSLLKPTLTVTRIDARKMGIVAFDLLINEISNPGRPREQIVVPTQLVVNETGLGPNKE